MLSDPDPARRILAALREAVREISPPPHQFSLAFSGGLDSSVVAALAHEMGRVTALTVGYPNSSDLANAFEASRLLDLEWQPLFLDDGLLRREASSLLATYPGLDAVTLSFEIPLWILLQGAPTRWVLAGQGADELFGGYARYQGLGEEALQRALRHDVETLLRETVPREKGMAQHHGRELLLPYSHPLVLDAAQAMPAASHTGPRRKELLRQVAAELGLPSVIVERPKKAAQYGSGVMPALRRLARSERAPILTALGPKSRPGQGL